MLGATCRVPHAVVQVRGRQEPPRPVAVETEVGGGVVGHSCPPDQSGVLFGGPVGVGWGGHRPGGQVAAGALAVAVAPVIAATQVAAEVDPRVVVGELAPVVVVVISHGYDFGRLAKLADEPTYFPGMKSGSLLQRQDQADASRIFFYT